jgi:hypothetical protein
MQAIPVTDPKLSHPLGLEGIFNNSLILQPSEFKREPSPLGMDAWSIGRDGHNAAQAQTGQPSCAALP